jgi:hypothetical protein
MFIGPGLEAGAEAGTKYHGAGNHYCVIILSVVAV